MHDPEKKIYADLYIEKGLFIMINISSLQKWNSSWLLGIFWNNR